MSEDTPQLADTLESSVNTNASDAVLEALMQSEKAFRTYNMICDRIDRIYSARGDLGITLTDLAVADQEYDLFWASMEILKPAIYAKPPSVVAKPRFSDSDATVKVVAELMERVVNSEFERSNIDQVFLGIRDDLALLNRGVPWVTLDEGSVCVEHLEREDFRHEPARKWSEVGWVARRAWLTRQEMADRFRKTSGDAYMTAAFEERRDMREDGLEDTSLKAGVWEVWSKPDNKVFWVTDGVDVFLDEDKPHLSLRDFFPCPRPAYGTLKRRTLQPIPDYVRYANHLDQINTLTGRIYALLSQVKMRGLIAGGGDVANAVQAAMSSNDDSLLIPVSGAALLASGGAANMVQWVPLMDLSNAITGLIAARQQLFDDFYQLSGISDIMRGATEAQETLGAQQLKSQYGSIRIKDKVDEIVRVARDVARISVEIVCDNFTQEDLLEISQMEIPTRADVDKQIKALKKAAEEELKALAQKAEEAAGQAAMQAQQSGEQIDPAMAEQAQQQFEQAQQQIIGKYKPQLDDLSNTVVIEAVMDLIDDRKDRALMIDIETDSTVLADEQAEKQSRNELLAVFSSSMQQMQPMFALGDVGVKLAAGMIEFTLQPYVRGNRQIQQLLDDLVEQAPQIAAKMAAATGEAGADEGLIEAQKTLAEAEGVKAQAAMESVKARAMQADADNQRKIAELQQRAQADAVKAQEAQAKLQLQLDKQMQEGATKDAKTAAEIDLMRAKIAEILNSIGLDVRKQELDEYQAASADQARQVDQAMAVEGQQQDAQFRAAEHERADRGEDRADRGQEFNEQSSDRQMSLAEKQAQREGKE